MNRLVTKVLNEILWEFVSQNQTLSETKGKEEEVEEEPWRVIGFLEGTGFLGAIVRKLGRRKKENTVEEYAQERRKREV